MKRYSYMIIAIGMTFLMLLGCGTYATAQHRERPMPPKSQHPYRHDVPPPAEGAPRIRPMTDSDFSILYNKVKKKAFKNDKLDLVEVGCLGSHFLCSQCRKIMSLFSFDDDRLAVVELMGSRIIDMENVSEITEGLSFIPSREKALRIIQRR